MSIEKFTLRKPLLVNGKYLKELTYDIDEIGFELMARAEGLKTRLGGKDLIGKITLAQADYTLHMCIGMQAIMAVNPEISEEDLLRVKGYDLTRIANIGSHFFIEPEEQALETSSEPQEDTQDTTIAP